MRPAMTTYVYDFIEGNKDLKDLLGGKGAILAETTRMSRTFGDAEDRCCCRCGRRSR
jgi:hypothetical protein